MAIRDKLAHLYYGEWGRYGDTTDVTPVRLSKAGQQLAVDVERYLAVIVVAQEKVAA